MAKLPSGITQRGNSFRVNVTWQGDRKTGTAVTLEEAIGLRARLDAQLKNPNAATEEKPSAGGSWSIGNAFDRTLEIKWKGNRAEHTAEVNGGFAVEFFGRTRKLDTIDTDAIDGYVSHLMKIGNSDGTINRKLAALSTMLRVAHERGKLATVPKLTRRKESKGRIRFLSDDEEATVLRLLGQWDKHDDADAVAVLLDTGVRLGELLRIDTAKDMDGIKRKQLHVWETKGDLPRTIPLTARAHGILTRRAITHKGKLFPYHEQWMRHTWDRARALMGLADDDQFVIHALRHTFASRLVQKGVPIQVVQQLLGHKDIKMTMRYAHLSPANLVSAIALLEPAKPTVDA